MSIQLNPTFASAKSMWLKFKFECIQITINEAISLFVYHSLSLSLWYFSNSFENIAKN